MHTPMDRLLHLLTFWLRGSLKGQKDKMKSWSLLASNLAFLLAATSAQNPPATPPHEHDLMHRGAQGMGFDQGTTRHHFLLQKDGGAIQVMANSVDDRASVSQIRMHLRHITRAFQSGDFNIPGFVHDQTPPGVPVMIKLKDQIHFVYAETKGGGRVVISSDNADAVKAVQEFLRFQITEHKTGDALEVK
jgi:hypothetical protein